MFGEILPEIESIKMELPTTEDMLQIKEATRQLKPLLEVTRRLQKETLPFAYVRSVFDKLIEAFPLESDLAVDTPHVVSKSFESGLVKLSSVNPEPLTEMERAALKGIYNQKYF
jgi:hypothetical protein